MQHIAYDGTEAGQGQYERHDQFNAVILYDRAEAGRRAMNQLRMVSDRLAGEVHLRVRLWRLDIFMDAACTLGDITAADVLVFALDDDESLNEPACGRLQEAVRELRGPGAAVAVLTSDGQTSPRFDFLRDAAREAGVGYIFPPAASLPAGSEYRRADFQGRGVLVTPPTP